MVTIHISELEPKTTEIVGRVRDHGETIEIMEQGQPIARIAPVQRTPMSRVDLERRWEALDQLAQRISAEWPEGVSAVEAVREQRRDL